MLASYIGYDRKRGRMALAKIPEGPQPDLRIDSLQLEKCVGTTIGTRVDLQGGGFIVNQYLNVDGVSQPTDITAIKNLLVKDSTNKYSWRKSLKPKILIASLLLAVLVAGAIVGVVLYFKTDSSDPDIEDAPDTLPMNYTARLRSRSFWSADEENVESKELLYKPARFLVVGHTDSADCTESVYCENLIRSMQRHDISSGLGDIGFNFLIGGDGYIYEGRGWGIYGAHTYGVNCASVGVVFIGNYDRKRLRTRERNAFRLLVEEGLRLGELDQNYKLFGQYQVYGKPSPGLHIRQELKDWDHYAQYKREDNICLDGTS